VGVNYEWYVFMVHVYIKYFVIINLSLCFIQKAFKTDLEIAVYNCINNHHLKSFHPGKYIVSLLSDNFSSNNAISPKTISDRNFIACVA
jgi:hypothetical protein